MFVFINYQVDSLVLQEYVPKGVSPIVSTSPSKWLNIVLGIKQYTMSLHGEGGDKRDAFRE